MELLLMAVTALATVIIAIFVVMGSKEFQRLMHLHKHDENEGEN